MLLLYYTSFLFSALLPRHVRTSVSRQTQTDNRRERGRRKTSAAPPNFEMPVSIQLYLRGKGVVEEKPPPLSFPLYCRTSALRPAEEGEKEFDTRGRKGSNFCPLSPPALSPSPFFRRRSKKCLSDGLFSRMVFPFSSFPLLEMKGGGEVEKGVLIYPPPTLRVWI